MKGLVSIFRRESRDLLISPIPWVATALFFLLGGVFYFSGIQQFRTLMENYSFYAQMTGNPQLLEMLNLNRFVISGFLGNLMIFALFLVPILVMRTFAKERQQGTDALLLTAPVTPLAIVGGKYLALLLLALSWVPAAGFYVWLTVRHGTPETAPILIGLLGFALALAALVSISMAIAAWTRNAILSAVGGFMVLLLLYFVQGLGGSADGFFGEFFNAIGITPHYQPFLEGRVRLIDVYYFLALIILGLFITRAAWIHRRIVA